MASMIAGALAKGAFNIVAKDRNILIPLDDIGSTSILTDAQLKLQVGGGNKKTPDLKALQSKKELDSLVKTLKQLTKSNPKKLKTNLEKILERQ
jgi:hypothetical protein